MKKTLLLAFILNFWIPSIFAQTKDITKFDPTKEWYRNYLRFGYFNEKAGLYDPQPQGSFGTSQSEYFTYLIGGQVEYAQNYYHAFNKSAGIFVKANLITMGFFLGEMHGTLIGIPTPGIGFHLQTASKFSIQPYLDYRLFFVTAKSFDGKQKESGISYGFLPGIRFNIGKNFLSFAYSSKKVTAQIEQEDVRLKLKHFNFGFGFRF
ncbi:MAG: hypothetical protein N4A41_11690 [Crocinitomicaceae bacterium]|jgi:hypothetical protein|nr:hypothetical protein [Crocinitomicaceae bacterium]